MTSDAAWATFIHPGKASEKGRAAPCKDSRSTGQVSHCPLVFMIVLQVFGGWVLIVTFMKRPRLCCIRSVYCVVRKTIVVLQKGSSMSRKVNGLDSLQQVTVFGDVQERKENAQDNT